MSKYTFVGDIHGKVEKVQRALDQEGQIIFVGDFMDSWHQTLDQHKECLVLVLDAIEAGKARSIYGNHELSYMNQQHRCSGYDYRRHKLMDEFLPKIEASFEPYILLEPTVLISHAGLTNDLWQHHNLTCNNLKPTLDMWWPDWKSPIHQIGRFRGGYAKYGGLFWCDFNMEFIPVPGLTQIFGHTAGTTIRQVEQSFCIDCLDHEDTFLSMEFD